MTEVHTKQVSSEPINVFVSHSSRDKSFYNQLRSHLQVLENGNIIYIWEEREDSIGEMRQDKIDAMNTHLHNSQLILLLVSAFYLASDYLYDEVMKRALELHEHGQAHVVPIVVRDCDWQSTPLQRLSLLPHNQEPIDWMKDVDKAFDAVVQDISVICNELHAHSESPSLSTGKSMPGNEEQQNGLKPNDVYHKTTNIQRLEVNAVSTSTPIVFISYSHKDDEEDRWLELLHPFLAFVEQTFVEQDSKYKGSIKQWSDKNLRVGTHWHEEIQRQIALSAFAILLVSANFLVSEYINQYELPQLLEREKARKTIILPVIVGHCEYKESKLSHIQSINQPGKPLIDMDRGLRQKVMLDLASEIRKYLKSDNAL